MYKTIAEVTERLAKRYSGPIAKREGQGKREFSYVPWHVSKRLLDEVFGPFGWTTSAPHSYFDNGTFVSEFGLTVRVLDEDGNVIEKTVPAQGQSNVLIDRDGNPRGDDNAVKSAQSDALSRGTKLLGDAFGFFLYEHEDDARPATNASASAGTSTRQASGGKGYGPSAGQLKFLHDLGWTDAAIKGMEYKQWKAILDNREHAPEEAPAAEEPEAEFAF